MNSNKVNCIVINILLWCSIHSAYSQILLSDGIETFSFDQTTLRLDGGGHYGFFQDKKFLDIPTYGYGVGLGLVFERITVKSYLEISLLGKISNETPLTFDKDFINEKYKLSIGWSKSIIGNFYLGAKWSVLDFILRQNKGLNQNDNYYMGTSDMFLSFAYFYTIKEDKKFKISFDFALASYIYESLAFAFPVPQKTLERGGYTYDFQFLNKDFYNDMVLGTFDNYLNLNLDMTVSLTNRIVVSYNWAFKRFYTITDYPLIYGQHTLSLGYNIIRK